MTRRSSSPGRKFTTAVWLVGLLIGAAALLGSLEDRDGTMDAAAKIGKRPVTDGARTEPRSTGGNGTTHEVTASRLRLRVNPSAESAIRGGAGRGERVDVLGQQGAWFDVRMRDGTRGWMHGDHLTPSGPQTDLSIQESAAPSANRSVFTDAIGRATITDGDTIHIGETRIRLQGIDAPETGQACEDAAGKLYPCGGRAANALDALIAGQTVACRRDDTDRYGRMVGTCAVLATGENLNAAMVSSGWALAYRQYSTAYLGDEAAARTARRGLWQGAFVPPWDFRAGERLAREQQATSIGNSTSATAAGASGSCLIKGNISESGHIYHLPGSKWYEKTRIDIGRGERWFCSEGEAQAAGWRAPRG